MGCNCKKRVMQQMTSVNQPVTELDRPDIVAARVAAAQERVEATRTDALTASAAPSSQSE